MSQTAYPVEVVSIVRKNKTFAINSFLYRANGYNDESPYKVYGNFSRFAVSILDSSDGTKKTLKANLRTDDIPIISRKTDIALQHSMFYKPQKQAEGGTVPQSEAYTLKFNMGKLKGKTPAQVILEGNGKELVNQRKFLADNIQKYPANRKFVNAIDEAIQLYRQNKLENVEVSDPVEENVIEIYKAGMHPLVRKTRQDGKCFVYDFSITWKMGADYPVTLSVVNYYATVVKKDDGRLNVTDVDNSSRITTSVSMTDAEWVNIIESINRNMRMFEILHAKQAFQEAEEIYRNATGRQAQVQNNYAQQQNTVQYRQQPFQRTTPTQNVQQNRQQQRPKQQNTTPQQPFPQQQINEQFWKGNRAKDDLPY